MRSDGMYNAVNDQLGNPQEAQGQKGSDQTKNNTENHDRAACFPNDSQDGGHISQSGDALTPSIPRILFPGHGPVLKGCLTWKS